VASHTVQRRAVLCCAVLCSAMMCCPRTTVLHGIGAVQITLYSAAYRVNDETPFLKAVALKQTCSVAQSHTDFHLGVYPLPSFHVKVFKTLSTKPQTPTAQPSIMSCTATLLQ